MKTTYILKILLPILALGQVADGQSSNRYSFRRVVTIQDDSHVLVRRSTFTFNDQGEQVETEVVQTGKLKGIDDKYWSKFPVFPMGRDVTSQWAACERSLCTFTVAWTDERGLSTDMPSWSEEENLSGLFFPVIAEKLDRSVKTSIRFYDYRLFRTSVAVKEAQ
jgi:hypothetical protein